MEGSDSKAGSAEVIREAQNWQEDSAAHEKGPAYSLTLAIVVAPAVLEAGFKCIDFKQLAKKL